MRNQVFHLPDCSGGLEPALASKIAIRSILSNLKASGRKGRIVRQACVEESSGEAHGNLWVCYAAVEVINKYTNQCQVFACVAHVEGGTKQCPVVSVSILSEEDNPKFCACPHM